MYLGLERRKGDTLAVNADVAIFLVFGNETVSEDLAVPDARHVKEIPVLDCEHHLHG